MKILFILLVISNTAYLAWNLQLYATPAASIEPSIPEGVKRLVLLSEADSTEPATDINTVAEEPVTLAAQESATLTTQESATPATQDPVTPDTQDPVTPDTQEPLTPAAQEPVTPATQEPGQRESTVIACYSIGPYDSERNADNVRDEIEASGFAVRQRTEIEHKLDTIWVYLPPYESRIAALEVTTQLDAKGATDYYVIPTPPKRNAISLGLYKRLEPAKLRVDNISSLGFTPEMESRYEDINHYWIDYEEKEGKSLDESVWDKRLPEDGIVTRIERSCN